MKKILLTILGIVALIIIFVSVFDRWNSIIPIRWWIPAWIVLLIIIGIFILVNRSEIKDIRWAIKKSTKILKQQRIGSQTEYWLVRQILFKHQNKDVQVKDLYLRIKALDSQSEDLVDKLRKVLNDSKTEGYNSIFVDQLFNRIGANSPDIMYKYERVLLSWGLKLQNNDSGTAYYDLTGYEPF